MSELLGSIPSKGRPTIPPEQPSEMLGGESRQETAGKKLGDRAENPRSRACT